MKTTYKPKGTCSNLIEITTAGDIIEEVKFTNGCPGNLLAIGELIKGMEIKEAIRRLDGIMCGKRKTSCADQLAQALKTVE